MRIFIFTISLLLLLSKLNAQTNIILDWDSFLHINDLKFRNGTLSLSKIQQELNAKSKVKRRCKRNEVPYFNYYLKGTGIMLISASSEMKSDRCGAMLIYFDQPKKEVFNGEFEFLGVPLDKNTTFQDIYFNEDIAPYIDKSYNTHIENLYKGFVIIRLRGYKISFDFQAYGRGLRAITIDSFLFDPDFPDKIRI